MPVYLGSCHCGGVGFEVDAVLSEVIICDCSICSKRNAAMVVVDTDSIHVTRGADLLTVYSWNTHTAKHNFCKHCGIYMFHRTRTLPGKSGVNVMCLDSLERKALPVRAVHGSELSLANPIDGSCAPLQGCRAIS